MVDQQSSSSKSTVQVKTNRKAKRKTTISSRPPLLNKSSTLSSKATRNLIRSHHTLQKRLVQLESNPKDQTTEKEINDLKSQISNLGGLKSYQQASSLGQSKSRGGDSSQVLVQWIREYYHRHHHLQRENQSVERHEKLRILEIGSLSTRNALNDLSKFEAFDKVEIKRIDLQSRERGIEEIDFMNLPIPSSTDLMGYYDLISLSLVLNFVPDPISRGQMLRRTISFFDPGWIHMELKKMEQLWPCLFLVLPLACIDNSRYLDEKKLNLVMDILGYEVMNVKRSQKLYYSLWSFWGRDSMKNNEVLKSEVRKGNDRNNFCIILEKGDA